MTKLMQLNGEYQEDMSDYTYLKDINFTSNNTYITSYSDGEKVSIKENLFGNNELLQLDLTINNQSYNIQELQ